MLEHDVTYSEKSLHPAVKQGSISTRAGAFDWRAAVEKMTSDFERACNEKDVTTIGNMYAENAILLPPFSPLIRGKKNIEQYMKDFFFKGAAEADIHVVQVTSFGDIAYEIGAWEAVLPLPDGGMTRTQGKYCVLWKRQPDDTIKVLVDMFNTDK
jgi:ketosteroid isomerase-like protein